LRKILFLIIPTLICFVFANQTLANSPERIGGKDRFHVAVNISQKGWTDPSQVDTVILANYLAFADALSATPLAYQENAPILLTRPDHLEQVSKDEILRLKPNKVIIVGGAPSVSDAVLNEVKKIVPNVQRIGGNDRFEVSANIAKLLTPTKTAVVSNGLVFSDALSIAPYAARNGYPILLVRPTNLPDVVKAQLNGKENTVISGGEPSVGKVVYDQLPTPKRIGGSDRYAVSANIIKDLNLTPEKAYIATGLTFADALTGSVLAAKENAPLLLTRPTSVPDPVRSVINEKQIKNFTILGGASSVSDGVAASLVSPLAGKTIMLDPGHGCDSRTSTSCNGDPGAVANGYWEVDLNDQLTARIASYLKAMGATIIYTRGPNEFKTLEERADYANQIMPDLFVSIHHDAAGSSAKGSSVHYSTYRPNLDQKDIYILMNGKKYTWLREDTENKLFYYNDNGTTKSVSYEGNVIAYDTISPSIAAQKSKVLAELLVPALEGFGINDRMGDKPRDHNLFVTRKTKVPAVLFEAGYVTNSDEVKILADPNIQDQRAKKIADAIKNFFQ
jgi:N-acetylmuramoyl-L-alanine amidase